MPTLVTGCGDSATLDRNRLQKGKDLERSHSRSFHPVMKQLFSRYNHDLRAIGEPVQRTYSRLALGLEIGLLANPGGQSWPQLSFV